MDKAYTRATMVDYDPALFRSKESDRLLASLLDDRTEFKLTQTSGPGNSFAEGSMVIRGPMREFLIELLTRLRVGSDVELTFRPDNVGTGKKTGGE